MAALIKSRVKEHKPAHELNPIHFYYEKVGGDQDYQVVTGSFRITQEGSDNGEKWIDELRATNGGIAIFFHTTPKRGRTERDRENETEKCFTPKCKDAKMQRCEDA